MKNKDIIKTLQKEIEIPDIVQKKADAAFAAIRGEAGNSRSGSPMINHPADGEEDSGQRRSRRKKGIHRHPGRKIWIAAAAAVLAVGTITAVADYMKRSKSLTEGMQVTDQQQIQMQEKHLSSIVNQSCTDQGITVTAVDSITDNYYTHIAFRVEGYKVDTGIQPDFGTIQVTVDGNNGYNEASPEDSFNYVAGFYNGFIMGEDGKIIHADGSPIQTDEAGNLIENYTMDDGTMEYQITLSNTQKRGFFINKPVHVELSGLGTVARAAYENEINGTWTFDLILSGSPELKECSLNTPLGSTGASVVKAEISPISLGVEYEFPRQMEPGTATDENGQVTETQFYAEPPRLMGVRMKDGTMYPYIYLGPGSAGYESEESSRYRTMFAIDRVLDVEQVESLLFEKPASECGTTPEEMFYMVPVG